MPTSVYMYVCAVFMMQKFSVKYLSRCGTMCIFPFVNICFSCYIFLHSISFPLRLPHWVFFPLYPLAATLPKLFAVRTDATVLSKVAEDLERQFYVEASGSE
jgi:hypothetical protein